MGGKQGGCAGVSKEVSGRVGATRGLSFTAVGGAGGGPDSHFPSRGGGPLSQ